MPKDNPSRNEYKDKDAVNHPQDASGLPITELHITMAAPEIAPLAKTGGLADVLGALPVALKQLGIRVSLIMPAYRSVLRDIVPEDTGVRFTVPVSNRCEEATVLKTYLTGQIPVYLIRADKFFDREYLYSTPDGDYPDNAERFVFFSRAVLEVAKLDPPHILHCHDWQSALAIVFLKAQSHLYPQLSPTKTVITIHNLGYQGLFWHPDWHLLNLSWSFYTLHYLEFWNRINFLKGALVFADAITTVSPTYAEEIKTAAYGFRLEGVLQEYAHKLVGILNGVDSAVWNPETDRLIARNYRPGKLSGKEACKADLQRSFGLPEAPNIPVLGMISRLAQQKGFDLLEEVVDDLLGRDLEFVLLGNGEEHYQEFFREVAKRYQGKVGVKLTFSEELAHKIVAGADMLIMPSQYEPGGLTQIYGLKYGTIPIVRATGGLKDTVQEFISKTRQGTGFCFIPYEAPALLEAVDRALSLFQKKRIWASLIKNAMAANFSWDYSAQAYRELYQKLVSQ